MVIFSHGDAAKDKGEKVRGGTIPIQVPTKARRKNETILQTAQKD